jgi:hypothetical protein
VGQFLLVCTLCIFFIDTIVLCGGLRKKTLQWRRRCERLYCGRDRSFSPDILLLSAGTRPWNASKLSRLQYFGTSLICRAAARANSISCAAPGATALIVLFRGHRSIRGLGSKDRYRRLSHSTENDRGTYCEVLQAHLLAQPFQITLPFVCTRAVTTVVSVVQC